MFKFRFDCIAINKIALTVDRIQINARQSPSNSILGDS